MTDAIGSEPLHHPFGRRRFMAALTGGLLAAPLAAAAEQAGTGPWGRPWPPVKGLGPGVSHVVVEGNPNLGPHTVHARYPAGHTVGPHRHKSAEHVIVLSGTLLIGWGELWDPTKLKAFRAGEDIVIPPGVAHFSAAPEETVMEVRIAGPYDIEYVLDTDDPRR